jgi:hypothetical protein
MLTRADKALAFDHIIRVVFDQQGDTPLTLAFQQNVIRDVSEIINMHHKDIIALKYVDGQGVERPVPMGYLFLIRILKAYHKHRYEQSDPIGDNWTSITLEMFDDYRLGPDYAAVLTATATSTTTTPSTTTTTAVRTPSVRDPVADFKKGIKRDPTVFPVFKEDRLWDAWQRSTLAQARAQDVVDVMNPS